MKFVITSSFFFLAMLISSLPGFSQESNIEIGLEGGPNALFSRGGYPANLSDPLMGGRIWLESQKNEGTTFHFTLPKKH